MIRNGQLSNSLHDSPLINHSFPVLHPIDLHQLIPCPEERLDLVDEEFQHTMMGRLARAGVFA